MVDFFVKIMNKSSSMNEKDNRRNEAVISSLTFQKINLKMATIINNHVSFSFFQLVLSLIIQLVYHQNRKVIPNFSYKIFYNYRNKFQLDVYIKASLLKIIKVLIIQRRNNYVSKRNI